jgi:F-type H+-transporting ATPase subunit b
MEIIKNFGIDWVLLGAQAINFLIIAYILKRFAYKPILGILKQRQETVKKGLKDAEEAQRLLDKATEKEREILRKAQSEAKKLLDDAKSQRDELLHKSEEMTRKEADRMLKEAREQIAYDTREAERRLTSHVSELAMQFLQRSLEEVFDENEQEIVMRSALKRIKTKKN